MRYTYIERERGRERERERERCYEYFGARVHGADKKDHTIACGDEPYQ